MGIGGGFSRPQRLERHRRYLGIVKRLDGAEGDVRRDANAFDSRAVGQKPFLEGIDQTITFANKPAA